MIEIELFSDSSQNIKKYKIKGHANFASYGEDIVCSAVSVLSQTVIMGLVEILELDENKIFYKIDENTGYLEVELKSIKNKELLKETQILLKTFKIGIESIEENYPRNVNIEYRRCD